MAVSLAFNISKTALCNMQCCIYRSKRHSSKKLWIFLD